MILQRLLNLSFQVSQIVDGLYLKHSKFTLEFVHGTTNKKKIWIISFWTSILSNESIIWSFDMNMNIENLNFLAD